MFYSPDAPTRRYQQNLPHWRQRGVIYFVTFRLADSIPQDKLREWLIRRDAWVSLHPLPWDEQTQGEYLRTFPAELERWLDAGHGSCVLAREDCIEIVKEVVILQNQRQYLLDEWTIMPNHVHALVTPLGGHELSDILHDWKVFSSNRINKLLNRQGKLWQKESFDHIVRDAERLEKCRRYIRNNGARRPS